MSPDTKQKQIYDLLKDRIESGYYPPGFRLPKEVDLAVELNVSRVTLRSALYWLEMEKLIRRITRKGTFVRDSGNVSTRIMVLLRSRPKCPESASDPHLYILPCLRSAADRQNIQLDFCEEALLLSQPVEECAAQIRARGIEGIFWLSNRFNGTEPLLKLIRVLRLPVLLPHGVPADAEVTGFAVLGTNYRELIRSGLKYLAMQGHRRAAYIGGPDIHNVPSSDYLADVKEAGLDPDSKLLQQVPWREGKQVVFEAVGRLMKLSDPPTAILSYSDYLSLQIYEYLHLKNIRIPKDVCVLTIGGQIGCDFLNPPLSALEYGNQTIADLSVETMLKMIHDKCRLGFLYTPHSLRVRESTERILFHTKMKDER